ncbi:MAG: hypothetical protein KDD01_06195 [Phaeodactylibacter sp.]|nr:hypothetical protein [Phaeodactylibacter sp.]
MDRYNISISEGYLSPADTSWVSRQTTGNNPTITNSQQPSNAAPHFSLKNGTLSLFDPFAPSFNIAAEHILRPRVYAQLEAGPLFNLRIFKEPAISNLKGYRLRGAIRYYLRPLQIGDYAPFIELLYTNQYTEADVEGDFRRNTSLGRYRQRITYHMEQRKQGGFLNLGLQQIYAQRFIFEFGAGLGISHKRSAFSEVPADASFRTNGSLGWEYDPSPNGPNVAAVQVYINLGYVLK